MARALDVCAAMTKKRWTKKLAAASVETERVSEGVESRDADPDEPRVDERQVVDIVTGQPVKLNAQEQIRQEEQRKLLEEFGYPDDTKADRIRRDFRVRPKQLRTKRCPLVVLGPKVSADQKDADRAFILFDIQPPKTKAEDGKKGAEILAEILRDTPGPNLPSGRTARIALSIGRNRVASRFAHGTSTTSPGTARVRKTASRQTSRFSARRVVCHCGRRSSGVTTIFMPGVGVRMRPFSGVPQGRFRQDSGRASAPESTGGGQGRGATLPHRQS